MSREREQYPEILDDLAARAATVLAKAGLADEEADALGFEIAEQIRANWAGQLLYIPKGQAYEINKRDEQLWEQFNGQNHEELAREHKVSVIHVYRVIKAMRARHTAMRQSTLFTPPKTTK